MTLQEIFDRVLFEIRGRNYVPAMGSGGSCFYRMETPEGIIKCAAGILIPDELYVPSMEGASFEAIFSQTFHRKFEEWKETLPLGAINLISDLQLAHDNKLNRPGKWEQKMRDIALHYYLNYTKLDEEE